MAAWAPKGGQGEENRSSVPARWSKPTLSNLFCIRNGSSCSEWRSNSFVHVRRRTPSPGSPIGMGSHPGSAEICQPPSDPGAVRGAGNSTEEGGGKPLDPDTGPVTRGRHRGTDPGRSAELRLLFAPFLLTPLIRVSVRVNRPAFPRRACFLGSVGEKCSGAGCRVCAQG